MFGNWIRSGSTVVIAALFLGSAMSSALGQAQGEFSVFNDHDPESATSHIYPDWDLFLDTVVFDVGYSFRYRGSTSGAQVVTGSRLAGLSNRSRTWLEGNRVRFHIFTDETQGLLQTMKEDMVRSAEKDDIASWNRDEQLAYWLNIHNLLVMQVAAEQYPYRLAKKLHRRFWTKDMVTIKGVSLSIQDIQDEIILSIWDDPMVIYGLFQAAIGGPSLQPRAYIGKSIDSMLQSNGEEFVNSYRGVYSWGKAAVVSEFYQWTARAFPDFETDLRRHINGLADTETAAILRSKSRIRARYFSWNVPGFFSGRMFSIGNSFASSAITALAGGENFNIDGGLVSTDETFDTLGYNGKKIPQHTRALLSALQRKFRKFDMPNSGITFDQMLNGS